MYIIINPHELVYYNTCTENKSTVSSEFEKKKCLRIIIFKFQVNIQYALCNFQRISKFPFYLFAERRNSIIVGENRSLFIIVCSSF